MADIFLDKVIPITGETVKDPISKKTEVTDYAKILTRLFTVGNTYTYKDSPTTETVGPGDVIYLNQDASVSFYSVCIQPAAGINFAGTYQSLQGGREYIKSAIKVVIPSRNSSALQLVKSSTVYGVSFSDAYSKSTSPFIFLTQSSSSTSVFRGCNFGSYPSGGVAIRCQQATVECTDCTFSGEGTSLFVENPCTTATFTYNLNHGVARAVKSTASACKFTITNNTLDIGGQLFWSEPTTLSVGSKISFNVVENHEAGLSSEANNGDVIYIKGTINGIEISDNIFSGADGVNGDTSNTTQKDSFPRRPTRCIGLDGINTKTGVIIQRNEFRFPKTTAITAQCPIQQMKISSNSFSGISGSSACLFTGTTTSSVSGSFFNYNILRSSSPTTKTDLFNFGGRNVTGTQILGNMVTQNGDVSINLGIRSASNIIRKNFEDIPTTPTI